MSLKSPSHDISFDSILAMLRSFVDVPMVHHDRVFGREHRKVCLVGSNCIVVSVGNLYGRGVVFLAQRIQPTL